jgi:paraquat-inducible protein B
MWQRYVSLVRTSSQFWIAKGLDLSGSIFSGLKLDVESLRSLLSGGVEFATPDDKAPQTTEGSVYPLNDEPKKDWLNWSGNIPIPADNSSDGDKEGGPEPAAMPSAHQIESR